MLAQITITATFQIPNPAHASRVCFFILAYLKPLTAKIIFAILLVLAKLAHERRDLYGNVSHAIAGI